jgi:protein phosphatase PTC7
MTSAITGAAGLARPPRAGLLFLCLSTSSLLPPAHAIRSTNAQSPRSLSLYAPQTCPINRDTSSAVTGLRSFHSSSHSWKSSSQFAYHVAASYAAKRNKFKAEDNLYTHDIYDPSKAEYRSLRECKTAKDPRYRANSGQDAFFYSQVGTSQSTTFGVADGVGGWVESGIDPADFSHGLCEYMACYARSFPDRSHTKPLRAKDLLQVGYDEVIDDEDIVGGGSTACLAVAEPDGSVEVANLGDSGFMHLGLNAVRHFTQPQTHAFNTPFQLSKTPQKMLRQMAVFGGPSTLSDLPKVASVTHHQVRHGDVLVFATDGVWDNLSPQDVLGIVSRNMVASGAWVDKEGGMEVSDELHKLVQADTGRKANSAALQARLSIAIAKEAKETGKNTRRDGPFAREVQKYYPGENWHGGKPDDIAALVALVVETPAAPQSKL